MTPLDEQLGDKYEVLEKVRVGGMGAIYKVRHRLLDEIRIVKVIRRPGVEVSSADRFLREARAVIKLHHPNVAILHDFAVGQDGQAFIVMEFIEGWNLLEVLRAYGPPPLPLTIEIARQSLKALGYLHRHKIVHRDVSPDNLMLSRDEDGNPLVKLIDLGIAKALEEGPAHLTAAGVFLGKPRYGSPERFNGGEWDERSDLYSFGVVLYELLTNCCPIAGSDSASLMAGHLFLPPRKFEETDPGGRVPEELRQIVLKALAKKPEDRIASAEDFLWLLTVLQDRFPLTASAAEPFWRVFHAAAANSPEKPGSSVLTPLAIPLAMVKALAAGRIAPETVTVADAANWKVPDLPPAPEPEKPSPRDAWASRTLESFPLPEIQAPPAPSPAPETPPIPAAPPPKPKASRRPLAGFAVAGFVLGLILVGVWLRPRLSPRPAPQKLRQAAISLPVATAQVPPAETPAPAVAATPDPGETPPVKEQETPATAPASARPRQPPPRMEPGNMILRSFPGVQEPEIKQLPTYSYPAAAKGSGRRVSLRVAVLVDETGQVIDARIREGSPHAGLGFEETALEAARKAQFFPATRDGIAGKMWTELLLEFAE